MSVYCEYYYCIRFKLDSINHRIITISSFFHFQREQTGIGKTVANVRKLDGEAGDLARKLLQRWKEIVAKHETSSTSSSSAVKKVSPKLSTTQSEGSRNIERNSQDFVENFMLCYFFLFLHILKPRQEQTMPLSSSNRLQPATARVHVKSRRVHIRPTASTIRAAANLHPHRRTIIISTRVHITKVTTTAAAAHLVTRMANPRSGKVMIAASQQRNPKKHTKSPRKKMKREITMRSTPAPVAAVKIETKITKSSTSKRRSNRKDTMAQQDSDLPKL